MEQDIWFELEYSARGANDWYASNETATTEADIRAKLAHHRAIPFGHDYRVVRKTLTTEVLEG